LQKIGRTQGIFEILVTLAHKQVNDIRIKKLPGELLYIAF
jgi:hypothetical protein